MARNSEKQYGRLNRLLLTKEKEEYQKSHPKRPSLTTLHTVEDIKKWLPSIKEDMDFYLKKSMVICYSDAHIEEIKQKVVHLEGEYKAFVRKIAQLTPGVLDAVPWTHRAYKRKCFDSAEQTSEKKQFTPIITPVLNSEPKLQEKVHIPNNSLPLRDKPLTFICNDQMNKPSNVTSTSSNHSVSEVQSGVSFYPPSLNTLENEPLLTQSQRLDSKKQDSADSSKLSPAALKYDCCYHTHSSSLSQTSTESLVSYASSSDSE